ncbi:MAG: biotin--[acetyl-CoA-carboxylase] ligase [Alistipes sp.]
MFYFFEETTSTNDDARDAKYHHGDLIRAERQTAGRGQRGHVWESEAGCNLLFSVVLEPTFLPVNEQFLLSEAVALALTDMLAKYQLPAQIKWTNDIYIQGRKVVGILIEHNLSGATLSRTIVGVGINVNQLLFDPALPNPTSMRRVALREFDRDEVLGSFYDSLMNRYAQLERGDKAQLQMDYADRMYRRNEKHLFRSPEGQEFVATIRGVRPSGELLLAHENGVLKAYLFKEVEFVLHDNF